MDHYGLIILIMLGAGLLGGVTNFFRVDQEKKGLVFFATNVLLGISASLLIPLFLNMIASNLLRETSSDNSNLFILFGFCLIASLSSKAFIQTISDRLINDFEKTREAVNKIKTEIGPIISKETEPKTIEGDNLQMKVRAFSFDENAKKVLIALGGGKYAWRSLRGIAQETGIQKETVLNSLNWLLLNRLVTKKGEGGRWGLTTEGRDIFTRMSSAGK